MEGPADINGSVVRCQGVDRPIGIGIPVGSASCRGTQGRDPRSILPTDTLERATDVNGVIMHAQKVHTSVGIRVPREGVTRCSIQRGQIVTYLPASNIEGSTYIYPGLAHGDG